MATDCSTNIASIIHSLIEESFLLLNKNYHLAYLNRGDCQFNLGKYDLAIKDYNYTLDVDPNYGLAFNQRSKAYFYKQNYRRALDDLYKAYSKGYQVDNTYLKELQSLVEVDNPA